MLRDIVSGKIVDDAAADDQDADDDGFDDEDLVASSKKNEVEACAVFFLVSTGYGGCYK